VHDTVATDHSGGEQTGKASWYGPGFADHEMADGRVMDPHANVVASKTLPLGSTARVTNLATGKSTTVTVQDRGRLGKGRVVDVSPQVARELDLSEKQGLTSVVVKPITVPQSNGTVKLGAGAGELSQPELAKQLRQPNA
jgi:rare lipoprotein A